MTTRRVAFTHSDGKHDFVLLLWIQFCHDKVVKTNKQIAFIRLGDRKYKLSPDEVRQLESDRGQVQAEQEVSQLKYPEDFDIPAIQEFAAKVRKARNLDSTLTSDEDILQAYHLGRKKGDVFNAHLACAVLFAKDPRMMVPGSRIRFLRFEGEREGSGENYNLIKDEWIDGQLPALIQGAEKILQSQLRDFSRLGRDGRFETTHEYPRPAWLEAIVNACVHRSYSLKNMCIFIRMFDDRLVFESPGGFPPFVTPTNIYETQSPRNPFIMDVMMVLDYVKCAREGAKRMRDAMRADGFPEPEFAQVENGHAQVKVILRNDIKHRRVWIDKDVSHLVDEKTYATLSEREKRVLNLIAEAKTLQVTQVSRFLDVEWGTAKKLLMKLVEKGVLFRISNPTLKKDPNSCFILKPQAHHKGRRP